MPVHDDLNCIQTLDFHSKITNIDYIRSGNDNYLLMILKNPKNIYAHIMRFEMFVDMLGKLILY